MALIKLYRLAENILIKTYCGAMDARSIEEAYKRATLSKEDGAEYILEFDYIKLQLSHSYFSV